MTLVAVVLGGEGLILVGGSFAKKELYHPVPVFLLQDSKDYTGFARYEGGGDLFGLRQSHNDVGPI